MTARLQIGLPAAVVAGAAGILLGNAVLLVSGAVALVFAAYGGRESSPSGELAVDRTVEPTDPRPGQVVAVELRVANVGEGAVPTVLVRETVPADARLVDGETGLCTSLGPGEEATLSYTVRVGREPVAFDPPAVTLRNAAGSRERAVETDVTTTLTPTAFVESVPLPAARTARTGRVETDEGGDGVEFHAIREYQPGDAVRRIDWNRLASTTQLRTVQFRETRAATVLVLVDTSAETARAGEPGASSGRALSRTAARQVVEGLLDEHNSVGVACHGEHNRYLAPAAGTEQAVAADRFLDGDDAVGVPLDDSLDRLERRCADDAQVLYCSPLLSDEAADVARHFAAHRHAVTVVSPDVTNASTVGGTVAAIDRRYRLRALREGGVRAVDWDPDEPLDAALSRADHRWSR